MPNKPNTVSAPAGAVIPSKRRRKAAKPRSSPLWLHPTGQWAKKVRQRVFYFGTDHDAALKRWADEGPALLAGRARPGEPERVTIREVANRFISSKEAAFNSGELSRAMLGEYIANLRLFAEAIDPTRAVATLTPDDFERVRAKLAKGVGPVTTGKRIQSVRTCLGWAFGAELLDRPARFGNAFKKPSAATMRKARADAGCRDYTRDECRRLLANADGWLHAAILLAINAGCGNGDVAGLDRRHVQGEWVDFPRPKTGAARRFWLWPEAREALADVTKSRPEPVDHADAAAMFLTRDGHRLTRALPAKADPSKVVFHDAVRSAFERAADKAKVDVTGRGFYGLRSTYRTVADELADDAAVNVTMGHTAAARDMRQHYVRRMPDDRLRAVGEHVRAWLYADETTA